jgi:hypothetical protein
MKYEKDGLVLQLFGLRRSGNHALLSWSVSTIKGRVLHLNDITCERPYQCFFRAHGYGFRRRELRRARLSSSPLAVADRYLPGALLGRRTEHQALSYKNLNPMAPRVPKDALLLSYEDWELDHPRIPGLLRPSERARAAGTPSFRLLLLRDPYNLFASLLHSGRMNRDNNDYYVRVWKQYAREYLRRTNLLGPDLVRVSYNEWRESENYRGELCRRLGIPDNRGVYRHVPHAGGGSSFDGEVDDATTLRTDERWRHFAGEERYRRLFDGEVRDLAAEIFGPAPF